MALAYVTTDQIVERLSKKTAETITKETAGTPAFDSLITEWGEGVEGKANGYLGRKYKVPIDVSAEPAAADLFRSYLLDWINAAIRERRFKVAKQDAESRDRAIAYFKDVGEGKVSLPMDAEPAASATSAAMAEVSGPEREYTNDSLSGL